jgi:glutamyl-Q tRNA(Asp) synthetase
VTARRNAEGETVYPGTCRDSGHAAAGNALRLRLDGERTEVAFVDRIWGPVTQNVVHDIGDFVIARADATATYQLAVVVDDAGQGVTHVVRGADLLMNTPRQIYLQRVLRLKTPEYMHVPLVRNPAGEKLSKQTLAAAINSDEALTNLLAAWKLLRQRDLKKVSSVAAFWHSAIDAWDPVRLRADHCAVAEDNPPDGFHI